MWSRFSMAVLPKHNVSLQDDRFALIFSRTFHLCTATTSNWSVSSTICWKMRPDIVYSVKDKERQSAQKSVSSLTPWMRQLRLLNQHLSHGSAFGSSIMGRGC